MVPMHGVKYAIYRKFLIFVRKGDASCASIPTVTPAFPSTPKGIAKKYSGRHRSRPRRFGLYRSHRSGERPSGLLLRFRRLHPHPSSLKGPLQGPVARPYRRGNGIESREKGMDRGGHGRRSLRLLYRISPHGGQRGRGLDFIHL